MPNQEWDLSSIIDENAQAEIQKLTIRPRAQSRARQFMCRIGWHKYTQWALVSEMQMSSCNEKTGEHRPVRYDLLMRVCVKCGVPTPRLKEDRG